MMIPLGYEIADPIREGGKRVSVPLNHMVVLGQTQLSGKTTTLEALVKRSGLKAVAFITKPGEKSFRQQTLIPAFFSESTLEEYSKYVAAIIEQKMSVRLGWRERGWIVKLCREYERAKTKTVAGYKWKQPKTLQELLANVETALPHLRGTEEMICMQLQEYLKPAVKEIGHRKFSSTLELARGINVMDITDLSDGLKTLVIRSVIEWVHKKGRKIIVIVPEAWKFIPEGRSTPVKLALEGLIREGAGVENYVWMDSQDLRGVDKMLLRSVIVWLFGVQRQKNEVANTLASIPDYPKPTATEIMQLGKGEFYVCYGTTLVRTYVQPAGMEDEHARSIALGEEEPESWGQIVRNLDEGSEAICTDDSGTGFNRPAGGNPSGIDHSRNSPGGSVSEMAEATEPDEGTIATDSSYEEDMWKEKYEALKAEHQQLIESHDSLARRVWALEYPGVPFGEKSSLTEPLQAGARQSEETAAGANGLRPDSPAAQRINHNGDLDGLYRYIVDRAAKEDPKTLAALVSRPELLVNVKRQVIEASGGTLRGALAILISEKYFDGVREFSDTRKELIRRGFLGGKAPNLQISQALGGLVELGFLTKEETGYQAVAGMKVRIQEAEAK